MAHDGYLTVSGGGQQGDLVSSIPYSSSLDGASAVKSIVTSGAGSGRVDLRTAVKPISGVVMPAPTDFLASWG
jgi:hypothetical protein